MSKGSGMVWYIEQYDTKLIEDKTSLQNDSYSQNLTQNNNEATEFKGFSAILKPRAELSFIDILPTGDGKHCIFSSYIDDEYILTRYSGRFFVFHHKGKYLGQV